MDNTELTVYQARVPAEWLDYNGHMNDGAYAVAFSRATDRFMIYIGIDAAYRERTQHTIYTLENHICYLLEAKQGDAVCVTAQLLQHDAKRLRVFYALYRHGESAPLATSEQMLLHVDATGPGAAPFAPTVAERIRQLAHAQRGLRVPKQAGRSIRHLADG